MLTITIPERELWDEKHECFVYLKSQTIRLEHSLFSISKWESKSHKPFLSKEEKTYEETMDYIKCMSLDDDIDVNGIPAKDVKDITDYIEDSMTASFVNDSYNRSSHNKIITSELIYYWMVAYSIPFECEHWHLNRLLMLIRICNAENQDPNKNKMSQKETMSYNKRLNEERKKKLKTKG